MATSSWRLNGDYFETCSCDFLCPCISSNLAASPTRGHCHFVLAFEIEKGEYERLSLDGLRFVVVGYTPGVMGAGNWSLGVIVDERADPRQRDALIAIASGRAGGPMAALAPLVTSFLGVETKPIRYERDGLRRSIVIAGLVDQALEGVPSVSRPGEPVCIDNSAHPANARLALAKATRSHFHAFGLHLDETSGRNNGHFAPFSWQG